jgi:hypothetical protein
MGKPVSNTLDRASKIQWNSGLSVNRNTKYSKEKERKNIFLEAILLDNELVIPTIFKFHIKLPDASPDIDCNFPCSHYQISLNLAGGRKRHLAKDM